MRVSLGLGLWLLVSLPAALAQENLIRNGSFESNGGASSNVLTEWSIVDEEGGSGTWVAQSGRTGPVSSTCGPDEVEPPPHGSFAAMTTQAAPGSHVLYQDVTIPRDSTPILSFQFYVRTQARFVAPESLSFRTNPNQQFRVDVVDPESNPFTVDVLQNILVVGDGNATRFGYERHSVPLPGLGGRTVRIRFVEVDNQSCLYAGVDDVRLETASTGSVPPAIIRFTASPATVRFAGSTSLTWTTEGATSVEIDNGIGAVPLRGSHAVSLQGETTFTLTASGPGGVTRRTVTIFVQEPGPTLRFSASPSFIEKGQPATLAWDAADASAVSIDNGIGPVAPSGSIVVTPATTTEYTITATRSDVTSIKRATVFVDPGDVPIVSVTAFPNGIVQFEGAEAAVERFSLTNLGRVGTAVRLTQTGDFFTQSPASFDLPAGATQVVTITSTAQPNGDYRGTSNASGEGVPAGMTIPVRMFVTTAPIGTVAPTTAVARTEVAAPANENASGSVTFTNAGTGTLRGIVTADVAWLIPQSEPVVIAPGATAEVTFTTDRALRPDAASPAGAAVGTLTLTYIDSPTASSSSSDPVTTSGGSTTGTISVTVVDVVKASVVPSSPGALLPGEVAYFVPGLTKVNKLTSDLIVSVVGGSIADLRLYLGGPNTTPVVGSIDQIAPNSGLVIPSILQSLFASSTQTGTVQARSASLSRVALAGLQTISSSDGTLITALPTLRSDRAVPPGEIIHLPGAEKSSTRSTNLFVQEASGVSGAARIESLTAVGAVLSTRQDPLPAFGLLSLPDSVPAGTAAIRVTNTSGTTARLVAYATVVDASSGDAWTLVDGRLLSAASNEYVVAVAPPPAGVATANHLFVLNPNPGPMEITIEPHGAKRRRAAAHATDSASAGVTVAPGQTLKQPIDIGSGFVRVSAPLPFVLSARSEQSAPGRNGVFGTALPALPLSAAMAPGESRRFGGVDDSSRTTTNQAVPVTYRSSVGLLETSGTAALVRLTLRYTFGAGSRATAIGISSTNVEVPAHQLVMVRELARAVIGPSRDALGDLRNMQLDVEVVSGGRVVPFVQTVDNASSDSMLRID